jgi:hypothetical protein
MECERFSVKNEWENDGMKISLFERWADVGIFVYGPVCPAT